MMLAFQQAYLDKVDVLSLSLGSYLQWEEEDPFQSITSALEAQGIAVIVSSGNNGIIGKSAPEHYVITYVSSSAGCEYLHC